MSDTNVVPQQQEKTVSPLLQLTSDEVVHLETCLEIYRNDHGCTTPIEEFIDQLVLAYRATRGALHPERIEEYVEQLRDSFTSAIEQARFLAGKFPQLVKDEAVTPAES